MHTIEQELEVYVSPVGHVCIARRDMNEDCFVAVPPEEVDLLIDWLKEKKAEAIVRRSEFVTDGFDAD